MMALATGGIFMKVQALSVEILAQAFSIFLMPKERPWLMAFQNPMLGLLGFPLVDKMIMMETLRQTPSFSGMLT